VGPERRAATRLRSGGVRFHTLQEVFLFFLVFSSFLSVSLSIVTPAG
jgi:hypothetical protein